MYSARELGNALRPVSHSHHLIFCVYYLLYLNSMISSKEMRVANHHLFKNNKSQAKTYIELNVPVTKRQL